MWEKEEHEYLVLSPRECLRCGESCYPYRIMTRTRSGSKFPRGVVKVYWHCNSCSNWFRTMERVASFEVVDREELEEMKADTHKRHSLAYIEKTFDAIVIHSEP